MKFALRFWSRARRHISCSIRPVWMSRQPCSRWSRSSAATGTRFSGIELWSRCGTSTMSIHPDAIRHQVNVPVVRIYLRFYRELLSFNVSYLIVTCTTFCFSQAFAVVQHSAFRTEAAFSHASAADGSQLGDIRRVFKCR